VSIYIGSHAGAAFLVRRLSLSREPLAERCRVLNFLSVSGANLPACFRITDSFCTGSSKATRDATGAAGHNQVTVGVEDLKCNYICELIPVIIELDVPREPVCLRPGSSSTKNKGLGYGAITVTNRVPPDTQAGST
jgi:hypothetical protein